LTNFSHYLLATSVTSLIMFWLGPERPRYSPRLPEISSIWPIKKLSQTCNFDHFYPIFRSWLSTWRKWSRITRMYWNKSRVQKPRLYYVICPGTGRFTDDLDSSWAISAISLEVLLIELVTLETTSERWATVASIETTEAMVERRSATDAF